MKNKMTNYLKQTLAVILISAVLFMQAAPIVRAEDGTAPTPESETTTTNSNPDVISSDTNTSTSSTQEVEQNTKEQQFDSKDQQQSESSENTPSNDTSNSTSSTDTTTTTETTTEIPIVIEEGEIGRTVSNTSATALGVNLEPTSYSGTGDVAIETGDATNTAGILATGNNNIATSPNCCEGAGGASVINSGNGTESNNSGSATIVNNDNTTQDNKAAVNNNLHQDTLTGYNDANDNVGDSSITTGDANTTGTIITAVNTNVDGAMVSEFNINDDHIGDIVLDFAANCIAGCSAGSLLAQNSGNGSESTNDATLDVTNNNNTFQNNDATVGNDMYLTADSGNNSASRNTGGDSSIDTGDANIAANILTFANNNLSGNVVFGVINVFGDLIGDIIFPESELQSVGGGCSGCNPNLVAKNTGNGSNSTNNADIDVENNNDIFQTNDADITNNLIFDATTGDNQTSGNTGGNSNIETGDSRVDANVLNVVNNNLVGGNMWLVIINEAGNWIGKLIGAPLGQTYAGSEGTQFSFDENGYITATNNGNGTASDNNANVSQTNNNTTTQNNNANIVNNLHLDANTGGNKANDNTGGNSNIKTGDTEIVANLVNFVNNNIVGNSKLFVTVVNVFGNWVGDFVGPGQKKEEKSTAQNTGGTTAQAENNNNNDTGSSQITNNTSDKKKTKSSNTSKVDEDQDIKTNGNGTTTLTHGGANNGVLAANATGSDKNAKVLSESTFAGESAKKKMTINFAWIVLSLPLLAIIILGKKVFSRVLPRKVA